MLFDDEKQLKRVYLWTVRAVVTCIVIYLAIRHITAVAAAVSWTVSLCMPIIVGGIIALILNVPLRTIEESWFKKLKRKKAKRSLAILLSMVIVTGVFIGVAVLVVPKLVDAVAVVYQSVNSALDGMAVAEGTVDYSAMPFGEALSKVDVDWLQMKANLGSWMENAKSGILDTVVNAIGGAAAFAVDLFLGMIFAIYILANKEKLKYQTSRLLKAWLPQRVSRNILHICSVCNSTFRQFIAGQTTEAVILGSLCAVGMFILRIPYAPMIGALVGVTALIPYVGAFIATFIGTFMILTVNPFKALVFIVFLLTLQQVEGNLIYPKVVGAKINLSAMWVLAAITIGGSLAGPVGMLLGVPAASAVYTLLKEATEAREAKLKSIQDNKGEQI